MFGIDAVDIGQITKVQVGIDGRDGWFLEKIIVKSETLQKEW